MATALITGGTSGIGYGFARELASRGHDLVLVARDTERMNKIAAQFNAEHSVNVEVLTADLAVRDDVMRVAERLEDQTRPVELLINNAGFGLHSRVLDASELELHAKALDVMCFAVLALAAAAGRAMKERGHGTIINVSSTSSGIFSGNYSAIKSWVRTFSSGLALELKDTGVTVTALLPGWVKTEFHDRAGIKATNLPPVVWIDVDTLVKEALDDAARGRVESIPTIKWKVAMFVADHGPRAFTRWFTRKLSSSREH